MATRIDIARAVAEKEQISIKDANSIIASTIEAISIPSKTVVRFKPSKCLNPTPPAKTATKSRGKNQGRRTAGKRKRSR